MAFEVSSQKTICRRCGTHYPEVKGYFSACHCSLYKGTGYLPYCKQCVDDMYMEYLNACHDIKMAVRQICRKLDLYWSEQTCDSVIRAEPHKSVISVYLQRINRDIFAGKSYDTSLTEEGTLWRFGDKDEETHDDSDMPVKVEIKPPTKEVIAFWGPGYTPEMYSELEQRLAYYRSQMSDADRNMNTDALLRQIAMLEIDINRARADGRSVDKMVSTLNSLLSSLVKPSSNKNDLSAEKTPFGVWIKRFEDERPIPEPEEEFKDPDHIIRYIEIWFFGHLCHMLSIKNSYSKLYEEEISRLRVERPEFDDEDDESIISNIFGDDAENGGGA